MDKDLQDISGEDMFVLFEVLLRASFSDIVEAFESEGNSKAEASNLAEKLQRKAAEKLDYDFDDELDIPKQKVNPIYRGQQFGALMVLRQTGSRNTRAVWLCRCSCGREVSATTPELKRGTITSCGKAHT